MTQRSLTVPSTRLPMHSVRERPSSELTTAIRLPFDPGECLRRANETLALYFDPDLTPETKAAIREAFVRALSDRPDWVVQRAFDVWQKTGVRRPTPGEIGIICDREMEPITKELARRARLAAEAAEAERDRAAKACSPEMSSRILTEAGFTPRRMDAIRNAPPLVGSFAAAESAHDAPTERHWSETCSPDDPRLAALQKARDENRMVQDARQHQARGQKQ